MIKDAGINYERVDLDGLGEFYKVSTDVPEEYIESISWDKVNDEFFNYLKKNIPSINSKEVQ